MVAADSTDRPRGILTQSDREFLVGQKEGYSAQQKRDRRRKIRERVYHSLLDFGLLWMFLEMRDVEQIFGTEDDGVGIASRKAIQDAIAFLLLGAEVLQDNKSLRIAAAALQVAEAGGESPVEFKLRYPSQSDSESVGWTNAPSGESAKIDPPQSDESRPETLLERLFPSDAYPSIIDTTETKFSELSYLLRKQLFLGEIDADTLADWMSETGEATEGAESLSRRIRMEREMLETLPVQRHALSYPIAIDEQSREIIWAADIQDYDGYPTGSG